MNKTEGNKKTRLRLLKRVFKYMTYTHINLTSRERTYENDDDVIELLSL